MEKNTNNRCSGILLHISSLPSDYGIGTLGKEAYRFVDFLEASGQSCWQMLPLGPTGYGDSPYQPFSTFAGNPYFIDIQLLIEDGLLKKEKVENMQCGTDARKADYGLICKGRPALLEEAYSRGYDRDMEKVQAFENENSSWLKDFALFMALKKHFNMKPWTEWEDREIRLHKQEAVEEYSKLLVKEIKKNIYIQYLFFEQWKSLKAYAEGKGIEIIGDLPIYVPLDSADVWAASELFQLDSENVPVAVSGCPPDSFSSTGQLWGTPLYDWEGMKKDGFSWWKRRIASAAELFHVIRIDHFRGIESYWSIPYGDDTALNGKWIKGPGRDFVDMLKNEFPRTRFIAEDLGFLTEDVKELVRYSGFPGMKILQYAFDSREPSDYLPHNYERNCMCYTGTHDNSTLQGWIDSALNEDVDYAKAYLGVEDSLGWAIIRGGMASVADVFIAQMQDYLGLGDEARMNVPGTSQGNWTWRMISDEATDSLAERINTMTHMYGRGRARGQFSS